MPKVSVLLPVRGRPIETSALFPRLVATAQAPYELAVVVDADRELYQLLRPQLGARVTFNRTRQGYWKCLRQAARVTDGEFVVTLANDLLPGAGWLKRALDAHQMTFGQGEGLIGFNDGIHFGEHAAHFLVNRALLKRWYGDDYFPVCYGHNFGDVEISLRALEEGKFAVANFAVMFHNHWFNGAVKDVVYDEGYASNEQDRQIFLGRHNHNWTGGA